MSRTVAACLLAATVLSGACADVSDLVEVRPVGQLRLDAPAQTSVVLDRDGAVVARLHAEQDREVISADALPQHLKDAVVAIEDARFYEHGGVDGRGVVRALVANTTEGGIREGGSTITQQLAKNAVVGAEQTLERKLREASVALQIEAELSKEEILARYLNTVYFGRGAYGVATAARRLFGLHPSQLDLPQAALLAGLLRAPSAYDPLAHPEAAVQRRRLVLRRMAELGLISEADAARASSASLALRPEPAPAPDHAAYFLDHVLDELQHDPAFAALGPDARSRADLLFRGGLRVETTLDPAWQAAAEEAVAATVGRPGDPRAAVVAIDPATGEIRALVGGRDYDDAQDPVARFNLATDAARQPGSAFKPLVLAAALARGRTLDERFPGGAQITLPIPGLDEQWVVTNYDDRDLGPLTLREATAFSVNVVYARLIADIGPEAVVELARAAGVRRSLQPYLSLALGAQEVSPLELASVYATLAAGGVHRPPGVVRRVVAADGEVLYERSADNGTRVLDEDVAWLVTDALRDVIARGTGAGADLRRPLAGKTGTTDDGADAWFAGYTPDIAAAVWVGFPEGRVPMEPPRTRIRVEGGTWPAEIFARFGLAALVDVPARDFPEPAVELVSVTVDTTRDCLPNPYTPAEVIGERSYVAGTEPTATCLEPTGPDDVAVPDLIGLPRAAAAALLERAGLRAAEQVEFSPVLPPGYVTRQDPPAGAALPTGPEGVVTVWISSADRTPGTVPDVLGLAADRAAAVLEEAGFVVVRDVGCPDGAATCAGARARPGTVWEQSPDAGAAAPRRSAVRLAIYPG